MHPSCAVRYVNPTTSYQTLFIFETIHIVSQLIQWYSRHKSTCRRSRLQLSPIFPTSRHGTQHGQLSHGQARPLGATRCATKDMQGLPSRSPGILRPPRVGIWCQEKEGGEGCNGMDDTLWMYNWGWDVDNERYYIERWRYRNGRWSEKFAYLKNTTTFANIINLDDEDYEDVVKPMKIFVWSVLSTFLFCFFAGDCAPGESHTMVWVEHTHVFVAFLQNRKNEVFWFRGLHKNNHRTIFTHFSNSALSLIAWNNEKHYGGLT